MNIESMGPVDQRSFSFVSPHFGQVGTQSFKMRKGNSYRITLSHIATNREAEDGPDYDWSARVGDEPNSPVLAAGQAHNASNRYFAIQDCCIIDNEEGLLGYADASFEYTDNTLSKEAFLHVIKIDTETIATIPSDRMRKTVGVGEEVKLTFLPSAIANSVAWSVSGGGTFDSTTGSPVKFKVPDSDSSPIITATCNGQSLDVPFTVIEPSGIAVYSTVYPNVSEYSINDAGAGMGIAMWLEPDTVSFYNVKVMEVGMVSTDATGYFADISVWPAHKLDHGLHGANNPTDVKEDNYIYSGEDLITGTRYPSDVANSGICPQPWSNGYFSWPIPAEWWVDGSTNTTIRILSLLLPLNSKAHRRR